MYKLQAKKTYKNYLLNIKKIYLTFNKNDNVLLLKHVKTFKACPNISSISNMIKHIKHDKTFKAC